jgi:hypothetical protein
MEGRPGRAQPLTLNGDGPPVNYRRVVLCRDVLSLRCEDDHSSSILSYLAFCAIVFYLLRMIPREAQRFEMFKRAIRSVFLFVAFVAGSLISALPM